MRIVLNPWFYFLKFDGILVCKPLVSSCIGVCSKTTPSNGELLDYFYDMDLSRTIYQQKIAGGSNWKTIDNTSLNAAHVHLYIHNDFWLIFPIHTIYWHNAPNRMRMGYYPNRTRRTNMRFTTVLHSNTFSSYNKEAHIFFISDAEHTQIPLKPYRIHCTIHVVD